MTLSVVETTYAILAFYSFIWKLSKVPKCGYFLVLFLNLMEKIKLSCCYYCHL